MKTLKTTWTSASRRQTTLDRRKKKSSQEKNPLWLQYWCKTFPTTFQEASFRTRLAWFGMELVAHGHWKCQWLLYISGSSSNWKISKDDKGCCCMTNCFCHGPWATMLENRKLTQDTPTPSAIKNSSQKKHHAWHQTNTVVPFCPNTPLIVSDGFLTLYRCFPGLPKLKTKKTGRFKSLRPTHHTCKPKQGHVFCLAQVFSEGGGSCLARGVASALWFHPGGWSMYLLHIQVAHMCTYHQNRNAVSLSIMSKMSIVPIWICILLQPI